MPIRTGLEGLRSFSQLSAPEKDAFLRSHAAKLQPYKNTALYDEAVNKLYNNYRYVKTFGLNDFQKHPDYAERNNLYKARLIGKAFKENFSKDQNYNELENGLDMQGKWDLLRNKDYLTSGEISNTLKRNAQEVKSESDQKRKSLWSSFSFNNVGNANAFELYNQNRKADTASNYENMTSKNKSILEKLYSQTQKRREGNVSGMSDDIYGRMLQLDADGKVSLKQNFDAFNKIASQYSPYYAQFKDSKWLKDYSNTDKLKDYARFLALSQKYGDGVAITYLDRSMQNRVAKAQDWHWTGNTLMGVATTAISDLGGQVAMIRNAKNMLDPTRMGIINAGLNPDDPIYAADNKTIIGYKPNNNIWSNPAYWNDMYMYNTFDPKEMELIKQRGGVSKNINVREYGWNPNEHFISWDTAYEGLKQGGHVIAALLESGAGGVAGKAIGAVGKAMGSGVMKAAGALNASGKVLNGLSKTGQVISKGAAKTHNFAMEGLASLNGPQGEAMGTFNEQLENNKEAIQDQIKKDLKQYYNNINLDSEEAKASINGIYNELKSKDLQRLRSSSREGGMRSLPMSGATLMRQAKQTYINNLLGNEEKRLQKQYAKDMQEAYKNAAKTYMTNWAMDFGKEALMTHGVKKFLVAKGATQGDMDNVTLNNIIADTKTGGVRRAVDNLGTSIKRVGAKNMAKGVVKQISGGFADEYLDGINANFSEAAGSNAFKQYMNNQYDSKAYNDTMEGVFGNLISGINGAIDGIDNRENLYEGFIGAISPMVSVMPNVGSVFTPHETWNAIINGKDINGKKINVVDRMSYLINNPLLFEYAQLHRQDRAIDNNIKAINDVISKYKENGGIDDAAKAMSATRDYSTAYDNGNQDHSPSPVMAAEDNKLLNAFNLMSVAKTLEGIEGGTKSAIYEQTMNRLKGLADGSLSEEEKSEEVTRFLSDPDNKSILDNNTPEQAQAIAEIRLKKNAQFFMDLYRKKDEIETKLNNSPSMKGKDKRLLGALEYQLLAKDDWKQRLNALEENTGVSRTSTDIDYTPDLEMIYGSHTSRQTALNSRTREMQKITNAQLDIQRENDKSRKTIESLQERLIDSKTEDEKEDIQDKIDQENNLIKSRNLRSNQLKVQQDTLKEEIATLKDLIKDTKGKPVLTSSTDFSVDRILNSDARTRAEILNDANRGRYTQKQLKVIDRAKAKLTQQDPEALQKIQDAGELAHRVEDSNRVYDLLYNNPDEATAYFDAQGELRNRKALMESLQREIDDNYKKIDNVLNDDNSTDTDIRNTLSPTSSHLLNAYMEDNPNNAAKVKPYYDLAKFDEDAASIIIRGKESDNVKENKFRVLMLLQSMSNSKEELTQKIEDAIDSGNTAPEVRDFLNGLLDKMEALGYQRNATVVEAREKRRAREAEQKAQRDKEQAEREAKEKARQEEERKAKEANVEIHDEEEVPLTPDETPDEPLVPDSESKKTTEKPLVPDESTSTATESPDIQSDGKNATEMQTEAVDLGEQSFINSVMSDEMEDGDIDAGEIWHGTSEGPRKEVLTINKKGNNLTLTINGNKATFDISPNEYEDTTPEKGQNKVFKVTSMTKKDDGWYFNGNFAGENKQSQVKASDAFNLEKALDRQRESNERLYVKQGDKTSSERTVTDNDGNTTIRSETLQEQAESLSNEEKKKQVANITDNTPDTPTLNALGESINENNSQVMAGNGMSEWMMGRNGNGLLDEQGILEHKKGKKEGDHMNQFYAWTEEQGWHIQNIIDRELGNIILANPHAKFKFMSVTNNDVEDNTNDSRVSEDLFLVLDYDENINKGITSMHMEENGGVITADGKRYLVVGTVYQKSGNNEATSRNLLFNGSKSNSGVKAEKKRVFGEDSEEAKDGYGILYNERAKYRKEHPDERFFISDNYSTEIVPGSLIPGYMVKRQEEDTEERHRNLEELLNDKERNPYGYTLKSVPLGIQMLTDFYTTHVNVNAVMFPRNPIDNMGAAFVLFPACNGKYFCAHIDPLFYREMNDGSLKDRAERAINKLCSVDYDTRLEGIKELGGMFYFNPDKNQNGNFILTNKDGLVTFVSRGKKGMPIKVTKELDSQVVFNAFNEMNPRVNITMFNTRTEKSLKELSEAGALNINLAQLALAGASYSVYGVNLDGTLDKPSDANTQNKTSKPYVNNQRVIIYDTTGEGDTEQFVYNTDTGIYTYNGEPLTEARDGRLIEQLDYNRKKIDGSIKFIVRKHSDEYYLVSEGDNPLVVRINDNTHHVSKLSPEESQDIIDKFYKENLDKNREQTADDILETYKEGESPIAPEEAITELMEEYEREELESASSEGNTQENSQTAIKEYYYHASRLFDEGAYSISFKDLCRTNKEFFSTLKEIGKEKWEDFPHKVAQMEQYIRDKNMDVDHIPNSEEGLEAFLDTIRNCR